VVGVGSSVLRVKLLDPGKLSNKINPTSGRKRPDIDLDVDLPYVNPPPGNSNFDFQFGGYNDGSGNASSNLPLNGNIQEFIFYHTTQLSNRTGIESNINTFYSIY
jgi:hypothetical protein